MKKLLLLLTAYLLLGNIDLYASNTIYTKDFSWKKWEIKVHPEALNEEITNLYRCEEANYLLKEYVPDSWFHPVDFNGDGVLDIIFEGNIDNDCCLHTILFKGKKEQECGKYELEEIFYGEVISIKKSNKHFTFLIQEVSKLEGEEMNCIFQFDYSPESKRYEVSHEVLLHNQVHFPENFTWSGIEKNIILFKSSMIYNDPKSSSLIGHMKNNNYPAQVLYENEHYFFIRFPIHGLRRKDLKNIAPFRNQDSAVNILGWVSKQPY